MPLDLLQSDMDSLQSAPTSVVHLDQSTNKSHQLPGSTSPRPPSPASSLIFERDVQEADVPAEMSPAIPSHMHIDDHIPPVLEASSLAITDNHLGPDEVKIVTHSAHQPAGGGEPHSALHPESQQSLLSSGLQNDSLDAMLHHGQDGDASNYGELDPFDVRRLSFISFADVVHAEHVEHAEHAEHAEQGEFGVRGFNQYLSMSGAFVSHDFSHTSLQTGSQSSSRSPVSAHERTFSQDVRTPPLVGSSPASRHGSGASPRLSPRLSSTSQMTSAFVGSPKQHGELTIQTMRQALRECESGDFNTARSLPGGAVGLDNGPSDKSPFRD